MGVIITINVQKGGTGKTTTTHELSANLSKRGYKVLAIDLDPQMNLSCNSGAQIHEGYCTILDAIRGDESVTSSIQVTENYDISIAEKKMQGADKEFTEFEDVYRLVDALKQVKGEYDYIIVDTPPSLGILSMMALTAADYLLIPCEASVSGMQGLGQLFEKIEIVTHPNRGCNKKLNVVGILLTRFKANTNFDQSVKEQLKDFARQKHTIVFETYIREGIAVKEAQAWKQSLIQYKPRSNPALDYHNFTTELLKELGEDK